MCLLFAGHETLEGKSEGHVKDLLGHVDTCRLVVKKLIELRREQSFLTATRDCEESYSTLMYYEFKLKFILNDVNLISVLQKAVGMKDFPPKYMEAMASLCIPSPKFSSGITKYLAISYRILSYLIISYNIIIF
jgi:hypothetical protein